MKFRPHRGSLADAIAQIVDLDDGAALVAHLAKGPFPVQGEIIVRPYGLDGAKLPDARIGWADTWLVIAEGSVVGYVDEPPAHDHTTRQPWRPGR